MFAIDGEEALILDALPEDGTAERVLQIINEIHSENIAAVMAQGDLGAFAISSARWSMDRPTRPRSGLPPDWQQ